MVKRYCPYAPRSRSCSPANSEVNVTKALEHGEGPGKFTIMLAPSDGRPSTLCRMNTSILPSYLQHVCNANCNTPCRITLALLPHPEVFMDYVDESLRSRAWKYLTIEALPGMTRKFANSYILFYPVISRDGLEFPVNLSVREMKGIRLRRGMKHTEPEWRGNLVIAKYRGDDPFRNMIDISMADFPIIKNYFFHTPPPSLPLPAPLSSSEIRQIAQQAIQNIDRVSPPHYIPTQNPYPPVSEPLSCHSLYGPLYDIMNDSAGSLVCEPNISESLSCYSLYEPLYDLADNIASSSVYNPAYDPIHNQPIHVSSSIFHGTCRSGEIQAKRRLGRQQPY